jgi:hypothetical protein
MTQTQTQKILEKLDGVMSIVEELRRYNAAHVERAAIIEKQVAAHTEFINGNGKPGAKSDLAAIKQDLARINWIGGALLLTVIGDVMTRILTK